MEKVLLIQRMVHLMRMEPLVQELKDLDPNLQLVFVVTHHLLLTTSIPIAKVNSKDRSTLKARFQDNRDLALTALHPHLRTQPAASACLSPLLSNPAVHPPLHQADHHRVKGKLLPTLVLHLSEPDQVDRHLTQH
jgi:hypothetical protein